MNLFDFQPTLEVWLKFGWDDPGPQEKTGSSSGLPDWFPVLRNDPVTTVLLVMGPRRLPPGSCRVQAFLVSVGFLKLLIVV